MKLELAVAADYVTVDASGKLNIIGVFYEINPPTVPFIVPQMFAAVVLALTEKEREKEFRIRIDWVDTKLDRKSIMDTRMKMPDGMPKGPGFKARLQIYVVAVATVLQSYGTHRFVIRVDDTHRWEVEVPVRRPPGGGAHG